MEQVNVPFWLSIYTPIDFPAASAVSTMESPFSDAGHNHIFPDPEVLKAILSEHFRG